MTQAIMIMMYIGCKLGAISERDSDCQIDLLD